MNDCAPTSIPGRAVTRHSDPADTGDAHSQAAGSRETQLAFRATLTNRCDLVLCTIVAQIQSVHIVLAILNLKGLWDARNQEPVESAIAADLEADIVAQVERHQGSEAMLAIAGIVAAEAYVDRHVRMLTERARLRRFPRVLCDVHL